MLLFNLVYNESGKTLEHSKNISFLKKQILQRIITDMIQNNF